MTSYVLLTFLTLAPCSHQAKATIETVAKATEAAADEYVLPPLLLASLFEHEGACDPKAVSSVRLDLGLGQVRYKTALTQDPTLKRIDLFNPGINAMVAASYLRESINKCGSVSKGLGRYSSGKCKVNRYSRRVMATYFKLKKRYGLWKT